MDHADCHPLRLDPRPVGRNVVLLSSISACLFAGSCGYIEPEDDALALLPMRALAANESDPRAIAVAAARIEEEAQLLLDRTSDAHTAQERARELNYKRALECARDAHIQATRIQAARNQAALARVARIVGGVAPPQDLAGSDANDVATAKQSLQDAQAAMLQGLTSRHRALAAVVPLAKGPPRAPADTAEEIRKSADAIIDEARGKVPAKPPHELSLTELLYQMAADAAEAAKAMATGSDLGPAKAKLAEAEVFLERARTQSQVLYDQWFRTHIGAATVNPYAVAADAAGVRSIRPTTTTNFYAEADFLDRTAWSRPQAVSEALGGRDWDRLLPQDYEFRLGFVNAGQVDSSEKAASSDWFTEGSMGWNLVPIRMHRSPLFEDIPESRGTHNFEINAGFSTTRADLVAQSYYQAGLATAWSIPMEVADNTYRQGALFAGIYFGAHEFPRVDVDDKLHVTEARIPYNRLGSVAVKADFYLPLVANLEIVIQGRFAAPVARGDVAPDWSLFVGAELPLGDWVQKLFTTKTGE